MSRFSQLKRLVKEVSKVNESIPVQVGKKFHESVSIIEDYHLSARRAELGREPFPPPKEVGKILKNHKRLQKGLQLIFREGLEEPELPDMSIGISLHAETNQRNLKEWKERVRKAIEIREPHMIWLREEISRLEEIRYQARMKSEASKEVSEIFEKFMRSPLPEIGTLNKSEYFGYHQMFSKIKGSLNSISKWAVKAMSRLERDLESYSRETDSLQANS